MDDMRTVHFSTEGVTTECPLDYLTFECDTCCFNRGVKGFQVSCDFPEFPIEDVEKLAVMADDEKPEHPLDT